jgi:hypothetical protein
MIYTLRSILLRSLNPPPPRPPNNKLVKIRSTHREERNAHRIRLGIFQGQSHLENLNVGGTVVLL